MTLAMADCGRLTMIDGGFRAWSPKPGVDAEATGLQCQARVDGARPVLRHAPSVSFFTLAAKPAAWLPPTRPSPAEVV